MSKIYFLLLLTTFSLTGFTQTSFYDIKVKETKGGNIDMSSFKGKKVLIVNVASGAQSVSQYAELKMLFQEYKERGLVVICFPTNDFNSELKSDAELQSFFTGTSDKFLLGKKLSVKGNNISPLYEWLTQKTKNGVMNVTVKGDFQKFLISKEGKLIGFFSERVSPLLLDKAVK